MGAAASTIGEGDAKSEKALCGAQTTSRQGTCRNRAGFGTDHVGSGKCKLHLGSTRNGKKAAGRELAIRLGAELHMEPTEALLLTVRKAAMWEAFCAQEVARLDPDQVVVRFEKEKRDYSPRIHFDEATEEWTTDGTVIETTVETSTVAELHIWVREHLKALDQLARLAKVALDAGVQERQVAAAEQLAGGLARVIDAILTGHGITGKDRKPEVVRAALQLVELRQAA